MTEALKADRAAAIRAATRAARRYPPTHTAYSKSMGYTAKYPDGYLFEMNRSRRREGNIYVYFGDDGTPHAFPTYSGKPDGIESETNSRAWTEAIDREENER